MRNLQPESPSRPAPPTRWRGLPYATFRLVRRYGLPTSTAGTIAELAGFDTDMVRR
jgi:hypothetical protein